MTKKLRSAAAELNQFAQKNAILTFVIFLALLFGTIFASHALRTKTTTQETPQVATKVTKIYSAESPAYITAASTLTKETAVPVVALVPGIVQQIFVRPGQAVQTGTVLLSLTNDYNSGSAALQKAIAKNNRDLTTQIADLDKEIQKKEEHIIRSNDTLSDAAETVALKNLQKARESRKMSVANTDLSYALAEQSDAVLRPRALSPGFVQSIAVRTGNFVSPGTVVATLQNPNGNTTVEALLPSDVALLVDMSKEAHISFRGKTEILKLTPSYFSVSENADGMFMVQFQIPEELAATIHLGEEPKVELPLRVVTSSTMIVPLDAVFKTGDTASVFILQNGHAKAVTVTLGAVRGNFIEVTSGLEKSAQIILNRAVVDGEAVTVATE
jgi:RND family efflux transporter MFP subunit